MQRISKVTWNIILRLTFWPREIDGKPPIHFQWSQDFLLTGESPYISNLILVTITLNSCGTQLNYPYLLLAYAWAFNVYWNQWGFFHLTPIRESNKVGVSWVIFATLSGFILYFIPWWLVFASFLFCSILTLLNKCNLYQITSFVTLFRASKFVFSLLQLKVIFKSLRIFLITKDRHNYPPSRLN